MSAHAFWLQAEASTDVHDWKHAERLYRQALGVDDAHVPSLIGLSLALSKRGAFRESHQAALAAAELQPKEPPLIWGLAQRLRYFNEFHRLERCLSSPAFAQGAPATIVVKAAVMLSSIGAHDSAVLLATEALRREPNNAAASYFRGNLHLFSGELDAAERCYERALKSDSRLFQASWMLAGARTQTLESNHVDRLREQLTRATAGGDGATYISFALHKELHDIGNYAEAWDALEHGCQIKRRNISYTLEEDQACVRETMRVCTPAFVSAASAVEQASTPIFIVGMHRSGTTLMERMLAGHSQVGDAGETMSFDAQLQLATDHAMPGRYDAELIRRAQHADFDAIAKGYAGAASWLSRGRPFFTEKLPMNFRNVGFIAKALPQARILHLRRDPIDTCFSNLRTLFSGVAAYSYVQTELAAFYLEYSRLMDHWRRVLPPAQMLEVDYAELVESPEAVASRIARFCGLPYEQAMVDVGRTSGRVSTASAATARLGIRRDRNEVWRHYEEHLQPLLRGLKPVTDRA
jgi:tetratricopeptide (TPR) repeat protein